MLNENNPAFGQRSRDLKYRVKQHPETNETFVENALKIEVENREHLFSLIERGRMSELVYCTGMGCYESRLDRFLEVYIESSEIVIKNDANSSANSSFNAFEKCCPYKHKTTSYLEEITNNLSIVKRKARLQFVNFSGCERRKKFPATGTAVEPANISRSTPALGEILAALTSSARNRLPDGIGPDGRIIRSRFVPYRNSPVTHLLKEAVGGNCRTCVIVCVSPSADWYDDTLSALQYARRFKEVKNKPMANVMVFTTKSGGAGECSKRITAYNNISGTTRAGGVVAPKSADAAFDDLVARFEALRQSS